MEDDDAAFYIIAAAFKTMPISVQLFRAKDGREALTLLRNPATWGETAQRPDLVLLDLNLPGLNGFDVLTALRGDEALSSMPVVVFSSSSLDSDRKKSFALGAQQYITKPNSFDEVVQSLQTACSSIQT